MKNLVKQFCRVAVLSLLSGCASIAYYKRVSMEPEESPSVPVGRYYRESFQRSCFNATCSDFDMLGVVANAGGGPIGFAIFAPFFIVDIPVSLCTDIVAMPWQVARYRRLTDPYEPPDGNVPPVDVVPRSSMVSELLRWLKTRQDESGQFLFCGGKSELVDTALTVIACLHSGNQPRNSVNPEFSMMCEKGIGYLLSCAYTGGAVWFYGEKKDCRTFPIVADALISAYGCTKNPNLREIAVKCAERAANGDASYLEAELNDETVGQLRWTVKALQDAKAAGLSAANLDERLESVKLRLSRYGKWDSDWLSGNAERQAAVKKSIVVTGTLKDQDGNWRWVSKVVPCEGGITKSGLGEVADVALAVLQLERP